MSAMKAQSAHNAASRGDVSTLLELIAPPPDRQVVPTKKTCDASYKCVESATGMLEKNMPTYPTYLCPTYRDIPLRLSL